MSAYSQTAPCSAADETAIRKLVADFDAAAKTHDATKYASMFVDDVDWENAFGNRQSDRKALETGMTKVMKTFESADETITNVRVVCLRPDLALVDIYQTIANQRTPKGKEIPTRHIRMTQIHEKRGDAWVIRVHRVADLRGQDKKKP